MKIIHTSDWHIGREFENESLQVEQSAFLSWLTEQIKIHAVDLVVVAGDIYDKAMPKGDAVTLLDRGLDSSRSAGAEILLISGNHDNAARLNFGAQRQRSSGVYIYAQDESYPTPFLYEKNGQKVGFVAIPFLDPQRAPQPIPNEGGESRPRTHQTVLEDAIFKAREQMQSFGDAPTICVAHAYVQGSEISESERHSVGNADLVDAAIFDGFTYTALGHLHRPQVIPGHNAVAYSGSPLPYSFSEDHAKSVRLIELKHEGSLAVETLSIPVGRPVIVLTDSFDNLLYDPKYTKYVDYWVSAKLADEGVIEEPMTRLRTRFPHIAALAYADVRRSGAEGPLEGAGGIDDQTPMEVILDFINDLQGRDPYPFEVELAQLGVDMLIKDDSE